MAEEVFDAISHPVRIKILEKLAQKPMSFAELKRELGITSSGKLNFHLKKLDGLTTINEDGKYCLTSEGYAALNAIDVVKKYGWHRRAYILNILACIVVNAYTGLMHFKLLAITLPVTVAWILFYTYWNVKKRGLHISINSSYQKNIR